MTGEQPEPATLVAFLDICLTVIDGGLRACTGAGQPQRPPPAAVEAEELDDRARRRSGALMRVNHCGEICAQALYQGQALTAGDAETRRFLMAAAQDEEDHLGWCRQRLRELGSRPSLLDPAFYAASLLLGAIAGSCGDRTSLAFLEATEDQVRQHLDRHLQRLPAADGKSRAIVQAMRDDEERHRQDAARRQPTVFPPMVKRLMGVAARAMTAATYRL